jgi:hypothetical protein
VDQVQVESPERVLKDMFDDMALDTGGNGSYFALLFAFYGSFCAACDGPYSCANSRVVCLMSLWSS